MKISNNMKVVLLKEAQGLGHAGEIKEISDGYARNYLIPRGLAEPATKHNINVLEAQKKKREKIVVQLKKDKAKLLERIDGKKFEIKANTDETGSLYSKVGAEIIAAELKKQGFNVEASEIKLPEPIKKIGEREVGLELGGGSGKIKVEVKSEK